MMVPDMNTKTTLRRYTPFLLTLIILVVDQITKAWVVRVIPQGTVHVSYLNDFLWIVHVRNSAIGFSLGADLPENLKRILFIALPLVLLVAMMVMVLRSKELTQYQRWLVAGIIGGGLGNILDRMFRPEWVVDFISVRIYGLFGMERWPTFNVADSSLVVTGILLMLSLIFMKQHLPGSEKKEIPHE
jgi:signal peptidase II